MNRILAALIVIAIIQPAFAQVELPRREALKYAFLVSADLQTLQGTPIPTDVDLKKPVALRDGDHGALLLPEAKLSAEAIAKAGEQVVAVGQLWLHRLTPIRDGYPVPANELRLVKVEADAEYNEAVQLTLGVRGNGSGAPELLVLGKSKSPLLKVTLKQTEGQSVPTVSMKAARVNDEAGRITLKILGRYEASFMVTELGQ